MSVRDNVCRSITALVAREESKVAFAKKTGVSKQALNNWLQGKNAPDIETVARIAQIYGISFEDILNGSLVNEQSADRHPAADSYPNKLAEMRSLRHKTQIEVSSAIGITVSCYQSYESGKRDIQGTKLVALSKYFGCTVDELLGLGHSDNSDEGDASHTDADKFDEWALLDSYRSLDASHRQFVLEVVELLGGGRPHARETD